MNLLMTRRSPGMQGRDNTQLTTCAGSLAHMVRSHDVLTGIHRNAGPLLLKPVLQLLPAPAIR